MYEVVRKALLKQCMSSSEGVSATSCLASLGMPLVRQYDVPHIGGRVTCWLVLSFICRLVIIYFVWSEQ